MNAQVNQAVKKGVNEPPAVAERSEEDPRTRAAKRAAELREHLGTLDEGVDKFYIDPAMIPDGWSYEWKRVTMLGKGDPAYDTDVARHGWDPVPRRRDPRHEAMMPKDHPGNTIERDGMMLMERPKEITDEVKARDYQRARDQVRSKETQLGVAPSGQFDRSNKDQSLVNIKKTFENVPMPK